VQQPKISIITPALNAEKTIADALASVQLQRYPNYEHIIVDGGSSDRTVEIAKGFPNVLVRSGPDKGQSDAMNIGFELSSGEVIGYLNADDYYLPNAFQTVISVCPVESPFVVGPILILHDDGRCQVNRGGTTLERMVRHWEPDAFCLNPVGYFYRREVQAAVGGFNLDNHYSMDLEFLLAAARRFPLTTLPTAQPLGVFRQFQDTKTADNKTKIATWTEDYYPYLAGYARGLGADYFRVFQRHRTRAYAQRRAKLREATKATATSSRSNAISGLNAQVRRSLRRLYNQAAFLDVSIRTNRLRRQRSNAC
jgi:glycosyltransferase involved in cell wall biosynthesis